VGGKGFMTRKSEPPAERTSRLEIRPEPLEPVRRAIEVAVAAANEPGVESGWWRAGVEEALADAD
jgi:hypothetical protein